MLYYRGIHADPLKNSLFINFHMKFSHHRSTIALSFLMSFFLASPSLASAAFNRDCLDIKAHASFNDLSSENQYQTVLQCLGTQAGSDKIVPPGYCGGADKDQFYANCMDGSDKLSGNLQSGAFHERWAMCSCLNAICQFPDRSDLGTQSDRMVLCYGVVVKKEAPKPAPPAAPKPSELSQRWLDKIKLTETNLMKLPRGSIKVVDLVLNSFQTRYHSVKLGILKATDETDSAPLLYTTDGKNFYGSYDEAIVNKNKKLVDTFSLLRRQNPVNWKTTKFYDKPLLIDIALRLAADQPGHDEDHVLTENKVLTENTGESEKYLWPLPMSDYMRGAADYITRLNAKRNPNDVLDRALKDMRQRLEKIPHATKETIDQALNEDRATLEASYKELAARYALAKKLGAY